MVMIHRPWVPLLDLQLRAYRVIQVLLRLPNLNSKPSIYPNHNHNNQSVKRVPHINSRMSEDYPNTFDLPISTTNTNQVSVVVQWEWVTWEDVLTST